MFADLDYDEMKRQLPIPSNGKMALTRCGEMPVCLVEWSHWFGYGRRRSEEAQPVTHGATWTLVVLCLFG